MNFDDRSPFDEVYMKTDYVLIFQAVLAFFMSIFIFTHAQRSKESALRFVSLFFLIIAIRSALSYVCQLTIIDLVPVADPKESIFKFQPDPAKQAIYSFRFFTWQVLETMLPICYAYYIVARVLTVQRREDRARRARKILLCLLAGVIALSTLVIFTSLYAGSSQMFTTEYVWIEMIKAHIGYHLFAALRVALPIVCIWYINQVWGSAAIQSRAFSRYPGTLVFLMSVELAFAILTWVINPFFHPTVFLVQLLALLTLIVYAHKLINDLYIQANDRMEGISKERHLIISLVRKIGTSISAQNFSMETVSEDIIDSAVRILNANSGAVYMVEMEGNKKVLRAHYVTGLYPPTRHVTIVGTEAQINDRVLHETLAMGEGLVGEVARTGTSVFIPDTEADPRYVQTLPELVFVTSFIAIPLISQDEVFGVIAVTNDMRAFRQEDFNVLEILGNFDHMAFTIDRFSHHMNELVRQKTAEVEHLLEIQNGDYYLTSLLIKPLMVNEVKNSRARVDYCLDQKKKFNFRKWHAEIGGDICIAHSILLRDKKYTVFTNADAMGKSIQGAGGAIVYGVAFLSSIMRTIDNRAEQDSTPSAWLEQLFRDLQALFESFDGSMLISAVVGLIEEDTGLMWHFNCEHPWIVRYRSKKAEFLDDEDKVGRKIGTMGISEMHIQESKLALGDMIILGSDGRDDILLGIDEETGNRIINEDEQLFLRRVEEADGSPREIALAVQKSGELTDDLSIMRVCFLGGKDGISVESSATKDKLSITLADALTHYRKGDYEKGRALLSTIEQLAETNEEKFKIAHLFGNFYYREKLFDDALIRWKDALLYSPDNVQIQKNVELLEKRLKK